MSDPADNQEPQDAPPPGNSPEPAEPRSTPGDGSPAGSPPEPGGSEEGGGGTPQPPTQSQPPDWRDRRIERFYAREKDLQREIAALKARLDGQPAPQPGAAPPPVDIDRLATEKAQIIAAQQNFDKACNDTALEGRKAFPDFDSRIDSLRRLVNVQDPNEAQQYTALLTAAIDNGNADAARILHHLGGDLNEAQRILSLSPTRMAVEITKLAMRSPEAISNAPAPIRPVGGRQGPHTQIDPTDPDRADNLSTAEWMRRRNEQAARRSSG